MLSRIRAGRYHADDFEVELGAGIDAFADRLTDAANIAACCRLVDNGHARLSVDVTSVKDRPCINVLPTVKKYVGPTSFAMNRTTSLWAGT